MFTVSKELAASRIARTDSQSHVQGWCLGDTHASAKVNVPGSHRLQGSVWRETVISMKVKNTGMQVWGIREVLRPLPDS